MFRRLTFAAILLVAALAAIMEIVIVPMEVEKRQAAEQLKAGYFELSIIRGDKLTDLRRTFQDAEEKYWLKKTERNRERQNAYDLALRTYIVEITGHARDLSDECVVLSLQTDLNLQYCDEHNKYADPGMLTRQFELFPERQYYQKMGLDAVELARWTRGVESSIQTDIQRHEVNIIFYRSIFAIATILLIVMNTYLLIFRT